MTVFTSNSSIRKDRLALLAASIWAVIGESKVAVKELDENTLNVSREENSWNVLVDEGYSVRISGLISGSIYYLGTMQDESFARDVLAIASSVRKLIFEDLSVRDMEISRPTSFGPSDSSLIDEEITPPTSEVSLDNPQMVDDVADALSTEIQQPEAADLQYGGDGTFSPIPDAPPTGDGTDPMAAPLNEPAIAPPTDPNAPMPPQISGDQTRTSSQIQRSWRYAREAAESLRNTAQKSNFSAAQVLNLRALQSMDRLFRTANQLFPQSLPNGSQNVGSGQMNTPAAAAPTAPPAPKPAAPAPMTLNIGTPPTNNPAPKAPNQEKMSIGGNAPKPGEREASLSTLVDQNQFNEKYREGSVGIELDESNGLLKVRGFHEPTNLGRTHTQEAVVIRRIASTGRILLVTSVGNGFRREFSSDDPNLKKVLTKEIAALSKVATSEFKKFMGE